MPSERQIMRVCLFVLLSFFAGSLFAQSCSKTPNTENEFRAAIVCLIESSDSLKRDNEALRKALADRVAPVPVPTGAVVAFGMDDCPTGWRSYEPARGRVIVGTGRSGSDNYRLREEGGNSKVTLELANMPPHSHETMLGIGGNAATYGKGPSGASVAGRLESVETARTSTTPAGPPAAINVMPPFHALTYCKKE